jgi:hypothetical protein
MRIFHEPGSLCGYLAVSLIGLGVTSLVAARPTPVPASVPAITVDVMDDQTRPIEPPERAHEDDPIGNAIKLVFTEAGASYLALEDLDTSALPPHGKFHTIKSDYTTSALVALDKLPATARAWRDRKVIVDGTCEAKVVGFAIVARLSGDPGYADEGGDDSTWSTSGIVDHGHVMLAAKLDRCTGTFARAAAAPAIASFVEVGGGNVAEARARMIRSEAGAAAAKEWASFEQAGAWFDHSELATKTVRDPHTGRIWISMHAHNDFACGGPNINVWGLFRVEDNGALTTVQLRDLGTLAQIDQLVDIDGDGMPEVVGRGWLAPDAMITNAAGDELVRLDTPFFGCPC